MPRGKTMTGHVGWLSRSAVTILRVGSMHQRRSSGSGSTPAQLSNSCSTSAPASTCATR